MGGLDRLDVRYGDAKGTCLRDLLWRVGFAIGGGSELGNPHHDRGRLLSAFLNYRFFYFRRPTGGSYSGSGCPVGSGS